MRGAILAGLMALTLAGCSALSGPKTGSAAATGADEFAILPAQPLDMAIPATLPTPTPGGSNLADSNPQADALAALGGRESRAGIPASDAALIARVGRYGTMANIRAVLADEDRQMRGGGILGVFRGGEKLFRAYASMALDAYAELARFKAIGVQVPSAPPAN